MLIVFVSEKKIAVAWFVIMPSLVLELQTSRSFLNSCLFRFLPIASRELRNNGDNMEIAFCYRGRHSTLHRRNIHQQYDDDPIAMRLLEAILRRESVGTLSIFCTNADKPRNFDYNFLEKLNKQFCTTSGCMARLREATLLVNL